MQLEFDNKNPIIVGSGPSAAIVAEFLVSNGLTPTIFDAHSNENIDEESIEQLKSFEIKTHLGSFNSYYQSRQSNLKYEKNLSARQSFKFGGFSRVWGATLAFFPNISEWPQIVRPKPEDYIFTKNFLSWKNSDHNDLKIESFLPYPQNYINKINSFSKNYFAEKSCLGITNIGPNKCINLNVCLNGCPADSIWFSGNSLNKLIRDKKVNYIPGSFLHSIKSEKKTEKKGGGRTILSFQSSSGEFFEVKSTHAYLGLGPIGTAAMLIRSNIFETISILDSHTVYAGAFSLQNRKYEATNNLSKWWVKKMNHPKIAMQIYSPDVRFTERLANQMPKIMPFRKLLASYLSLHLHPMLIYFDTSISGTIVLENTNLEINVRGVLPKSRKKAIKRSLRNLQFQFLRVGLFIPTFAIKIGNPGSGYHSGSFLKLGREINEFGELHNFKGLHFVDSSTLPSIETGSITPTIMLNAVRIARITLERDI